MTSCKFCGNTGVVGDFPNPTQECYVQSSASECGNYKVAPKPSKTAETVNHPSHYGGDTPYEVIKVLENWLTPEEFVGGLKFNIIKYTARAGKKGDAAEDLAKAAWYAARLAEFERERNSG